MLCGMDYVLVYLKKQRTQILWPIYHWTLGFHRIPEKAFRTHIEVISCNGNLLDKPTSIRKFAKQNKVSWGHNSHYKYGLRIALSLIEMKKNPKNQKSYHKYLHIKKTFEANILSKLPCDTMKYNLMYMLKNFITAEERKFFLKSVKYIKQ